MEAEKKTNDETGLSIMRAVEMIAITPEDARAVVDHYVAQARSKYPDASGDEIKKVVAKKIIKRYSGLAATSGGATALAGVIPGVGTALSMVGGGLVDVSVCMKLQIDMTMCLAMTYKEDLSGEDAKHMSFIIALSGALEKSGAAAGTAIASKAGQRMVNEYLKGATLQAIKALFKKIGIIFTKKGAAKAIPFGVGVVIGSTAGYALTQCVGKSAQSFFFLEQ